MSSAKPSPGEISPVLARDLDDVLRRTEPLWMDLKGARIFLTGGTGFFGRWLLESFVHANHRLGLGAEIVVLSRQPARFAARAARLVDGGGVRLVAGDVVDFEFPPGEFSHVIHAASELRTAEQAEPIKLLQTTFAGCLRVLDFARTRRVRRFLFTSSGAVYGPTLRARGPLAEDDPVSGRLLSAQDAYAEAKRLAELTCVLSGRQHGFEVVIARGFAFLGPFLSLDSHLAAAGFMKATLENREIVIQGHGQTVRSYLYGADLAGWLWTMLLRGRPGRAYNLGSDVRVTIEELARAVAAAGGNKVAVRIAGRLEPGELPDSYVPNVDRARNELGLAVSTPLAEAIARSLEHYRYELTGGKT